MIQYAWCPYKKRSGPRHTQSKDPVKAQGEVVIYKPRKRGLRRTQFCWYLDLGLPVSETVRK